jgi:E3 ubiquitin-protein ligase BOI and related proteins
VIAGRLDRMGDLAVWVLSRGGGAPESSRMAAAMELQQGQKEAMAPQQAPPLFLDFSHGGNLSKAPALLCFCRISCSCAYMRCFRMARLILDRTDLFRCRGHADCGAGRKRQREAEAAPSMSPHLFSLQPQPQAQGPKVISLAQLHKRPAMGLRLDFDEGSEHVSSTSSASPSCLLSDELAAQRDQHRNEMDRLIQEHVRAGPLD